MKIYNEFNEFVEGDPGVDVMVEAGKEKESLSMNKNL